MTNCSFLHVADVHLDRPLDNIKRLDARMAERLHKASRQSFENVVDLAIEKQVACVVIAGDLFDGPVRDVGSGLWVEGQFKRLEAENIPVALILGNHDANSSAGRVSKWGPNVHQFDSASSGTKLLDSSGLAIHGQSFGARAELQDLAAKYPASAAGYFNIGVLHTSLAGSASHDTYAPTTVSVLDNSGYDYWALGHIHIRSPQSLSQSCYVGYSGNTQGCNIREAGAKGCQLVSIQDCELQQIEFLPTDQFRWQETTLDISQLDHLRDIDDVLETHVPDLNNQSAGRSLAVRLRLIGNTKLHGELSRPGTKEQLTQLLCERLSQFGDIWLESIKIRTVPDAAQLSGSVEAPIEYLSKVTESFRKDAMVRSEIRECLEDLLKKSRHELSAYGWQLDESESSSLETEVTEEESKQERNLDHYVAEAENLLVARLMGESP